MRRRSDRGFVGVLLLIGLTIFSVIGTLSVRRFTLPETRALEDPAGPAWPQIPAGLRRAMTIHPGDMLSVRVAGEDDMTGEVRVSESGSVSLPLVGSVVLRDLDVDRAAQRIANALRDGYLTHPEVTVAIRSSEHRTVFVVGPVRSPGAVTVRGALTLGGAITLAGGLSPGAGTNVIVARPAAGPATTPTPMDDPTARAMIFDLEKEAGAVLEDSDTIFIRARGMIAVMGGVLNPGLYMFEPEMTVAQAIVAAGGLRARASERGLRISRFVNSQRTIIAAEGSVALTPGDIVMVREGRGFFR